MATVQNGLDQIHIQVEAFLPDRQYSFLYMSPAALVTP